MVTSAPQRTSLAFQRVERRTGSADFNSRRASQVAARVATQKLIKDASWFLFKVSCATVAVFVIVVLCLAL
jgi:hypothetical protein